MKDRCVWKKKNNNFLHPHYLVGPLVPNNKVVPCFHIHRCGNKRSFNNSTTLRRKVTVRASLWEIFHINGKLITEDQSAVEGGSRQIQERHGNWLLLKTGSANLSGSVTVPRFSFLPVVTPPSEFSNFCSCQGKKNTRTSQDFLKFQCHLWNSQTCFRGCYVHSLQIRIALTSKLWPFKCLSQRILTDFSASYRICACSDGYFKVPLRSQLPMISPAHSLARSLASSSRLQMRKLWTGSARIESRNFVSVFKVEKKSALFTSYEYKLPVSKFLQKLFKPNWGRNVVLMFYFLHRLTRWDKLQRAFLGIIFFQSDGNETFHKPCARGIFLLCQTQRSIIVPIPK